MHGVPTFTGRGGGGSGTVAADDDGVPLAAATGVGAGKKEH